MGRDDDSPLCPDCAVTEGDLHMLGCDNECCPFCGGQLIGCNCVYRKLGIFDPNLYDSDIYENGLSDVQEAAWITLLEAKGRVPYIAWPIVCARCGTLWPAFFMVPDAEWEHYIQIDKRREVVCRSCYEHIKAVIDAGSGYVNAELGIALTLRQ